MDIKTFTKLCLATALCASTLFGIPALIILMNGITEYSLVLGIILGLVLTCVIINFGYPVWFRDYIDEYWKKQEEITK